MPRVLVSNNSELLRHLATSPFRRLGVEAVVASSGDEAVEIAAREAPGLAIVDAELPGISGYDVARTLHTDHGCKVVLVLGKRIGAEQMRRVTESGCEAVLVAPMSADELFDIVAINLGLPRRGAERHNIDLAVLTNDGHRVIDGRVTNLSSDGARMVLPEALTKGARLRLTITSDNEQADETSIPARVVWAQTRQESTIVGAEFEELDDSIRSRLARLTQWEIVQVAEVTRVVLKGDITEDTSFEDLLPIMVGRVDFDLSQVGYINSLGVREWVRFLQQSRGHGYEFHACSVPFVLQAAQVPAVLGKGAVASFFAPYHCEHCGHSEERLLQTATVLAGEQRDPPKFACPTCDDDTLELDDIPTRYLAFLHDSDSGE